MTDPDYDPLSEDQRDALAATGRALASVIPMFGGVIGELITQRLPGQRVERIVTYIRELEARIEGLEERARAIYANPEMVDLIEEGAYQAARATTEERIRQIAQLVANGLSPTDAEQVRRKRLATLLRQLDNDELAILNAYGQSYGTGDYSAWEAVNRPDPSHMQSSQEEIDAEKLYDAGRQNLLRLGLVEKRYSTPRRGEAPEFDTRKGDFKHNVEISYLGRMLLRSIGQPSPFDGEDEPPE